MALEKLVRRYESRVRAIGHRYSLAGADIDELFQEVRIRLWKALENAERIEGVSASYVHRATTTAAVDLIRRKRAGGERFPLDPEIPNGNPSNPLTQLEAQELAEQVSKALEKLDERRRPVVRMYLAGYGHKEIATLLRWSTATTRNLLYRGLADLRAQLAGATGGHG